jgi:hypothetical protein
MGNWTNNGLTAIAALVQAAITYVGISPGCGTVSSAIASGTPITSLPLDAVLPATLAGGQSLTVTDGTNSETVTVVGGGVLVGAVAISITSWTPAHSYVAHTTGVCPTPSASDTSLYNETAREPMAATSAGSSPGELLLSAYFDGTQATALYLLVGFFGGAATGTPGTGTLMADDIQLWSHVVNADTFMYQGDGSI